ncbi:MAG: DUF1697 domain-containing protein [Lysobacterales bacterium]
MLSTTGVTINPMKAFVALFRGINVGGNNILPMKELTTLFEASSCRNVKTYIQSGNVVFESENPPENIGRLIQKRYGFEPRILFLEKSEFLSLVSGNPYQASKGNQIHFYICQEVPAPNTDKLEELKSETEHYLIKGKVLYLYAPDGIGRSKLAANLERHLAVPTTGRNLNTVNKLIKMLDNI